MNRLASLELNILKAVGVLVAGLVAFHKPRGLLVDLPFLNNSLFRSVRFTKNTQINEITHVFQSMSTIFRMRKGVAL